MLNIRAVSVIVQLSGGGDEKVKPGREGIITSNETGFPVKVVASLVSWSMMGANSRNDPGQPWTKSSGMAFGAADFS